MNAVFLVDDLLLAPLRGVLRAVEQIRRAAAEESADEAAAIRAELSELYMLLETGRIAQEHFDAREGELLDRLEQVEARQTTPSRQAESEDP